MGLRRLDHAQLAMPAGREAEAVAFYEGVLGTPHVPKPDQLAVRGGCWLEDGDLKVHLGVDVSFGPATKAQPAFDVGAIAAAAVAAGFAVDDDQPLDGLDRVYVSDTFSNRIELMQPSASLESRRVISLRSSTLVRSCLCVGARCVRGCRRGGHLGGCSSSGVVSSSGMSWLETGTEGPSGLNDDQSALPVAGRRRSPLSPTSPRMVTPLRRRML